MDSSDSTEPEGVKPFSIKDCALVALATGKKARILQEFRNKLHDVDLACIYYHFWGGLLQPRFEEREYNNDFAAWAKHSLHDSVLAERLAALSPTDFPDLNTLRHEITDLIDSRLDEVEYLLWMQPSEPFEFIRSQIVVFDAEKQLRHPSELADIVTNLSTSSVFYHFIDARRRTEFAHDDFSDWLVAFKEDFTPLQEKLAGIDPYFGSLSELRDELACVFSTYFGKGAQ
jgi:hypothetical protein